MLLLFRSILRISLHHLTLLTLIFITVSRLANANSLPVYDASSESFDHPFPVYVVEDKSEILNVEQIATGQIEGYLTSSRFHIKSTDTAYWFSFALENDSAHPVERVVGFDEPYADKVSISYKQDGEWYSEHAGLSVPVDQRTIKNRNPKFLVTLDPFETKVLYLKLDSHYSLLTIGLYVQEPIEYVTSENIEVSAYFFYFGAAAALLIYNFFLYISLRDKVYIYYFMHGLCYVIWVLLYSGFDLYLGLSHEFHYKLNAVNSLIPLFLALLARSLLDTEKRFPRADKVLIAIVAIAMFSTMLSFIDIRYSQYLAAIVLPSYFFFMGLAIYAAYRQVPLGVYFFWSMLFYFVGAFALALMLIDVIPYNLFTRYFYLFSSLAEFTIFSFALAHRIKLLQQQNHRYQEEQIQVQLESKKKLELEVAARTHELREANNELARVAKQDGLTGIGNRRLLEEWIADTWVHLKDKKNQCAIILCDIDYFKAYNDSYGHQKGDECLKRVAQAIQSTIQHSDNIAIRYGGEEFLILLPNHDAEAASKLAADIKAAVKALNIEHTESMVAECVTLSFGVASTTESHLDKPDNLIATADKFLYQAKKLGRDRVCVA